MDQTVIVAIQVLYAIASLVLISLGLAIIYGMMRVINFAHGEFLMLGGYALVLPMQWGVNRWVAMFIVAPLFVGCVGMVVERLIIRPLYGRLVDTLLATWGLSLFLSGLASTVIGYYQRGAAPPFGSFSIGVYRESVYTLFVIAVTALLMSAVYLSFKRTRAGLIARSALQNPPMAAALGVNVERLYTLSFGLGAALAGLAGAILAPIAGVVPAVGATYITKAFITVVGGGAAALAGTGSAAVLFASVSQLTAYFATPVWGELVMLWVALLLLRVLPQGISGRFLRQAI